MCVQLRVSFLVTATGGALGLGALGLGALVLGALVLGALVLGALVLRALVLGALHAGYCRLCAAGWLGAWFLEG